MDWRTENAKDGRLLNLRGLAPLDPSAVAADGDLVAMVEGHNTRLARAVDRLGQLAADRQRLADFDAWQETDSADIAAARSRVRNESWDAVLELRRLLLERDALLAQMETRLRGRYGRASDAHDQAVAAAEKRLRKERRRLERANPATAGGHFADLVADEEPVSDAAERMAAAREALESTSADRRHLAAGLRAVTERQREVLAKLID
jgi:hypothetical protein